MLLVVWALAGTVVTVLGPAVGYSLLRPCARGLHWTERARRLSPLRACVAVGGIVLVPASLWLGWQLGGWRLAIASGVASWVGHQLSARVVGRLAFRAMEVPLPFEQADARRSLLASLPLHAAWLVPFAVMATWPAPSSLWAVGATLALMALYVRYQSHWLSLTGHFRGAHSTVRERVAKLSRDLPAPAGVFETQLGLANAMALPWSRELAITRGALHVLRVEELDAVIAHELEHLDESLTLRLSRLILVVGRVGLGAVLGYTASFDDLPIGLLVLTLVAAAALLVARLAMVLWSRGERDADHAGGAHDSPVYGRALVALYRANLFPVAEVSGGGHPPLYRRLEALGVEPDFTPTGRVSQAPAVLTGLLVIAYGVGMIAVGT